MESDARSALVRARRLLSLNRKIQACNRAILGLSRVRHQLDPDARIRAAQKIFALHRELQRVMDQSGELDLGLEETTEVRTIEPGPCVGAQRR